MRNHIDPIRTKKLITVRYEDLRSDVLRSGDEGFIENRGLVIFLRNGMLGWVEAWSRCSVPTGEYERVQQEENRTDIPMDLRGQVVQLLTNMAIGIRKEVAVN